MCVYANGIVWNQLRLIHGPKTNHHGIQNTRAYSNGEKEPKGPKARKRNAPAGRFKWIETRTHRSSTWWSLPQWWVVHLRPLFSLLFGCIDLMQPTRHSKMCVSVRKLLSFKPLLAYGMAQTPKLQCVISSSVLVCHWIVIF